MPSQKQVGSKQLKSPFTSTKTIGDRGEDLATAYLIKNGFLILHRNLRLKGGELDIIAKKNHVIHVVEVKTGHTFDPIDNMTPTKISRLIRLSHLYMTQYYPDSDYVIDALIVRKEHCELIENITF